MSPASDKYSEALLNIPEFRRLKYFFGQMLGAQDFQAEQDFFREKMKLHNRCLHGYGVVCGLLAEPVPIPKDCTAAEEAHERQLWERLEQLLSQKAATPPASQTPPPAAPAQPAPAQSPPALPAVTPPRDASTNSPAVNLDAEIEALRRELGDFYKRHCREEPRTKIRIECGLAFDCQGNELAVRRPLNVDLLQWLSPIDLQRVKHGATKLYVSLCYCERPVDPVRPVSSDACGATPDCVFSKLQDSFRVQVTVDCPAEDTRCGSCCEPCVEKCLLLAEITDFCPDHPLHEWQIHNGVRRPISLYLPTTIIGISWHTGGHYTQEEAKTLMGTREHEERHSRGLEIRFSRPVLASTIRPGVADIWIIEGGRGRRGQIYNKDFRFHEKPRHGLIDRIFLQDITDETLEPGDRVLITLRTEFILDTCCRPVDGENVGGKVPTIHEYAERYGPRPDEYPDEHPQDGRPHPHQGPCAIPPRGYLPWTSGNGTPGGTFVSWFFIRERERVRR
jgi:hypothetical protein